MDECCSDLKGADNIVQYCWCIPGAPSPWLKISLLHLKYLYQVLCTQSSFTCFSLLRSQSLKAKVQGDNYKAAKNARKSLVKDLIEKLGIYFRLILKIEPDYHNRRQNNSNNNNKSHLWEMGESDYHIIRLKKHVKNRKVHLYIQKIMVKSMPDTITEKT